MITDQPKTFENPNIVYITSVITKHPKTSQKLSKIIRKDEKVGLIVLYIVIQKKLKAFLNEKSVKMSKEAQAFKGYASTYHV